MADVKDTKPESEPVPTKETRELLRRYRDSVVENDDDDNNTNITVNVTPYKAPISVSPAQLKVEEKAFKKSIRPSVAPAVKKTGIVAGGITIVVAIIEILRQTKIIKF